MYLYSFLLLITFFLDKSEVLKKSGINFKKFADLRKKY